MLNSIYILSSKNIFLKMQAKKWKLKATIKSRKNKKLCKKEKKMVVCNLPQNE
jgi:hypothetical protein